MVKARDVVQVDYQQYPKGSLCQRSVDKREGKKAETLLNYARLKRVEWRGEMVWVYTEIGCRPLGNICRDRGDNDEPVATTAQVPINKFAFGMNECQPFRAALVNSTRLIAAEEFGIQIQIRFRFRMGAQAQRAGQPCVYELFKEKDIKCTQIRTTTRLPPCTHVLRGVSFLCAPIPALDSGADKDAPE